MEKMYFLKRVYASKYSFSLKTAKMIVLLITFFISGAFANTYSQSALLNINMKNTSVRNVINEIEKNSEYVFLFQEKLSKEMNQSVSINVEGESIEHVLDELFASTGLSYKLVDRQVLVVKSASAKEAGLKPDSKNTSGASSVMDDIEVKGSVIDEYSDPLPGVSIVLRGTSSRAITDANGEFSLKVPQLKGVLVFSFIGMQAVEKTLDAKNPFIKLQMRPSETQLSQVIVIGSVERNKDSFTGATKTVSGNELKAVGTQNVLQSLKTMDPSFVIVDNNLVGSNPNVMPTIELRGQTSLSILDVNDQFGVDPNQPLFILDGFETTLQAINDLDMNRVASVTLLKDAASTAIYGAKAANGVVVVETLKPIAGRIRVIYSGDYSVEFPDLSSYNMMNAEEKLEFERLSGRYTYGAGTTVQTGITNDDQARIQMELDRLYNERLLDIRRGVNSYWMSEPLQTAFTNRQSLRIEGGADELQFQAGLSYKNQPGIMIGSNRNVWSGNIDLYYRRGKLSINNKLTVGGFDAEESPYGSFSNYVQINPYYRKRSASGEITRYLEENINNQALTSSSYNINNPLYNAMLNSYDKQSQLQVQNKLQLRWNILPNLNVQAGLEVARSYTTTDLFLAPENTAFDNYDSLQMGTYDGSTKENTSYQANLATTHILKYGKSLLTSNLRTGIQETRGNYILTQAWGFPYGTNGNPSFASSYVENRSPSYITNCFRRVDFMGSVNYAYDERYLLDATFRTDGSTVFGSNQKFSNSWVFGLGWNLHKEAFLKESSWLDILRLRGNVGTAGNQNLGSVIPTSIYDYIPGSNVFGISVKRTNKENPDLKWQKTRTTSMGVDFDTKKRRFTSTFDVYQKYTDPLVVPMDLPSSTGVDSYAMNLGYLTTEGFEFDTRYAIINRISEQFTWHARLMGSFVITEYGGFDNKLDSQNKSHKGDGKTATEVTPASLRRYKDGGSPDDIWAVRSLGIDPSSGREVFLTKDGEATFVYNSDDEVKVGSYRPDVTGILGTSVAYKQLSVSFNMRFSLGGDIFNSALYNKVENISFQSVVENQDRRALYDRWQKPGDEAKFKSISVTSTTPISSRFVQKENYLSGESVNVSYTLQKGSWIKSLKMDRLQFMVNMNNFFRLSNVQSERGISYPFSKFVSGTITATF